jgi:hypothetical protein
MPKYKNKPSSAQQFASEFQQHFSTIQSRKVTINNLDLDTANDWKFYHQNPVDSADVLLTEKMPMQVPIFHVLIHQYLQVAFITESLQAHQVLVMQPT